MYSKERKEVMKRRGRPSPSPLNLYQKVVLLGGVLTVFLAIGIDLKMAPIISVGVIGVTLLVFFLVKHYKPKREEENKVELKEILPPSEGEAVEPQEIFLPPKEEGFNLQEFPPEEKESDLKEESPQEGEKVFELQDIFSQEREEEPEIQGVSPREEEKVPDLRETPEEEKVYDLKELILESDQKAEKRV